MDILILEASRRSILVARFRAKAGSLSFQGADRHPLTGEETFGLLCKGLAAADEGKERIVLSLHPAIFFYREMELPISDRRKVREVLPLELKGETAVDTDESVFDTIPLEGRKFLVAWGKKKEISAQIESMTRAELEPQIVTSAPFHWHSLLPEAVAGYVAFSDGTALSVYHNRELVYFRALTEGEMHREIEKTLVALEFSKGIAVSQVFLFGEAVNENMDSSASAAPGGVSFALLPVTGNLARTFENNEDSAVRLAGLWALAVETVSGSPVNFRYGDLAYTAGFDRARKRLRITAILASLFLILLFAETGIRYFLVKKDLDSLNNSIRTMYREIFPTRKKPVDEVAELKSEIKRMGGDAGTQNLLATMKKIAELKGDGISGFYEAEFEGNQARLKGDAGSFQAVNDFKTRAGALFTTAEVGEIKSRPGGGVSFSFRGMLQEVDK